MILALKKFILKESLSPMKAGYFTDIFDVDPKELAKYGAFNISLVQDLPLFLDPFLLFNSKKSEYQRLHAAIIKYVTYLKEESPGVALSPGLLKAWYYFPEVKQNWFGFTKDGNNGRGLGKTFGTALARSFGTLLSDFGEEKVPRGSHLEKVTLVKSGVGRDNISDFATNLIKGFLAEYTQKFALARISSDRLREFQVDHVEFNYSTHSWVTKAYMLPEFQDDYVLLTPKDLLTRDDTWINRGDLNEEWYAVSRSIDNDALRDQINFYFESILPKKHSQKDFDKAVTKVIDRFPILLNYYLRYKEQRGEEASSRSSRWVNESERLFIYETLELIKNLEANTLFYRTGKTTLDECRERIGYLKQVIEDKDGFRIFWKGVKPIQREDDVHILFKLTWFATDKDVNAEVNNGRGPVDFKVSFGRSDATLVEFKLASNKKLRQNLEHQTAIYQRASEAKRSLSVIIYFSERELKKVERILKELGLTANPDIILIDARRDNKPSGSKAN
ncbi:MAG: hypothetical protein ACHQNE_00965 [Candidatus Kapaibacterium sp.]